MLQHDLSSKLEKIIIIIFFCFIAIGMVWQVVALSKSVPFHDWDEAIYAQVAKEFVSHPNITLTYNGTPWFEKPPLLALYYGIAWILPLSQELVARLLSTLISLGSLLLVYALTRKFFASKIVSLIALLVCLQSAMFMDRSILVNVDMMLTFGWLLYLWGVSDNNKYYRFIGLVVGVLSKSLLGFVPIIVEILLDIISKHLTVRKFYFYITCISAGMFWYFAMFVIHGKTFLLSHFYDHLISRVIKPIELHFGGRMFYVEKIWQETGLLTVVACLGIAILLLTIIRQRKSEYIKLLTIIAVPLLYLTVLTVSKAKLHWYVTPMIPFIGIGTASFLESLIRSRSYFLRYGAYICIIGLSTFSSVQFLQSVLSIPPGWYIPTEKTRIAQCIRPLLTSLDTSSRILYLVPPQQRTDAQVIEAAELQIGSSFIYGSAPAFVYYVGRPVSFYYSPSKLYAHWQSVKPDVYSTIVVDERDLQDPLIQEILSTWNTKAPGLPKCAAGSLRAFIRDN